MEGVEGRRGQRAQSGLQSLIRARIMLQKKSTNVLKQFYYSTETGNILKDNKGIVHIVH